MKIKRKRHFEAEVSTSALNDIMFFLLLFFLIISTMSNPNVINLMLPKANSTQTLSKQQVTLSVTDDKRYYIDKQEVTLGLLEEQLNKKLSGIPSPTVILRFSDKLDIQTLVSVLEIGTRNKIKMVLATRKTSK
jgi:biopolymer transport protein ExbD